MLLSLESNIEVLVTVPKFQQTSDVSAITCGFDLGECKPPVVIFEKYYQNTFIE